MTQVTSPSCVASLTCVASPSMFDEDKRSFGVVEKWQKTETFFSDGFCDFDLKN